MSHDECDPDDLGQPNDCSGDASGANSLNAKSIDDLILEGRCAPPAAPSLPGLPPYQFFVDPAGHDDFNGDGTIARPFKTLYKACAAAIALGGGTVVFNDDTEVGGPVDGQGLWLRNDGIGVPGFLQLNNAHLRIIGNGNQSGQFVFENPGAARLVGPANGGTDLDLMTTPGIWVVGSETPVEFSFVKSSVGEFDGLYAPVRLGWDYARKPNFELEALDVTTATRDPGGDPNKTMETVFTVDLGTATPWTIQTATRIAGVVTLTLTRPLTVALAPWVIGAPIRVTTADPVFPSIDAWVTDQSDKLPLQAAATTITVSYAQPGAPVTVAVTDNVVAGTKTFTFANFDFTGLVGANITITGAANGGNNATFTITSVSSAHVVVCSGATGLVNETFSSGTVSLFVSYPTVTVDQPVTLGSVVSHGCAVDDLVMTDFKNLEFVTCAQMRVTAVTHTTITVFDPYGYTPRTPSISGDPDGNIIKQVRGRSISSAVTIDRCSFFGKLGGLSQTTDAFAASPTIDLGGTGANDLRIYRTYLSGGNSWNWPTHPDNYDPSRTQVAILADPGAGTLSGASFQAYDCQSQTGHVVWNPHLTEAHIYVDQWLQDSPQNALPTVVCGDGNLFASIYLHRIGNADGTTAALTIGAQYDPLKVQVGDIYSQNPIPIQNDSGIIGPTNLRSDFWSNGELSSPWKLGWATRWPGGLVGQHKGINWSMGVLTARLANEFPVLADWDKIGGPTAGILITQDGDAPDGSKAAFKIVNANHGATTFKMGASYPLATWSNGDGVVFGAWVKFPSPVGEVVLSDFSGGTRFDGAVNIRLNRYVLSDGWQPIMTCARLATSGGYAGMFFINCTVPPAVQDPQTMEWIPSISYVWLPTLQRALAGTMNDDEFYEYGSNAKHPPLYLPVGATGTPEGGKLIGHAGVGTGTAFVEGASAGQLTIVGSFTPKKYEPVYKADGTIKGWVELIDAIINP